MQSTHATLTTLREINASVVLDAIRRDPPLSRAEAARRIGMTKPTVANALDLLLAAGLVRETAPPGEIHYGATFFEPAADLALVLGLDIGGRFVRGALADLTGVILAHRAEPIADSAPATIVATAVALRDRLAAEAERSGTPIELALAGVPGVVDPAGGVIRQGNPPELEGVDFAAELGAALGVPATVENDVNLAAQGERIAGAGRDVADFAFLTIGTGVGAGLVLGGRPYRGHRGAAGEVDEPRPYAQPRREVPPEGDDGGRGPRTGIGRSPEVVHAPDSPAEGALAEVAARWIAEGGPTVLVPPVRPEEVFAAAAAGDPTALRLQSEEVRRVATRIAEISRVLDVELVVLGGGIGLALRPLLPELAAALAGQLRYPPRVVISSLGDTPVLVGATAMGAQLAWERLAARRLHTAAHAHTQGGTEGGNGG